MKILICEDELSLSENLAVILRSEGVSAEAAEPFELEAAIYRYEPDAVLLNEKHIGFQCCIPEDITLILTSSDSTFCHAERPQHILIKPYDGSMLIELLHDIADGENER